MDPAAVEKNYLQCLKDRESNLLPLILDITNPSTGIGWENRERMSLVERGPADAILALSLIHHLAISNTVPLGKVADFFRKIGKWLIVEFIPKEDSYTRQLLATRKDIFSEYNQAAFEREFGKYFEIKASVPIKDSVRTICLMVTKEGLA